MEIERPRREGDLWPSAELFDAGNDCLEVGEAGEPSPGRSVSAWIGCKHELTRKRCASRVLTKMVGTWKSCQRDCYEHSVAVRVALCRMK